MGDFQKRIESDIKAEGLLEVEIDTKANKDVVSRCLWELVVLLLLALSVDDSKDQLVSLHR